MVAETVETFLERLGDDELRAIVVGKLEGRTNDELAEALGCAASTVERRLRMIRSTWKREMIA